MFPMTDGGFCETSVAAVSLGALSIESGERETDALNHAEHHNKHNDVLRDAIIVFADGLTVPIALTAGLSS